MIKTLRQIGKQDRQKFVVPKGVQDVIPITAIYDDGIFQIGKDKFTKTFKFTDINYAVASREDKEEMFLEYSELLNSFDSGPLTTAGLTALTLRSQSSFRSRAITLTNIARNTIKCCSTRRRAQIRWFRTSTSRYLSARRISRMPAPISAVSVMI